MSEEQSGSATSSTPSPRFSGRCFCGSVQVEVEGEPIAQGYCHCESCRRHTGAPLRGFTLWPRGTVQVTRGRLAGFNKTGFSDRQHCTVCGGQVLIEHPTIGVVDVHSSTIPDFPFNPAVHVNYQEHVLPIRDGLPKLRDLPSDMGGSGEPPIV
jgi:hypothetical protein